MKVEKKLWKGTYNWYGEVHVLYRRATIKLVAETLLLRGVAEKMKVSIGFAKGYIERHPDSWKVEEEVK